jgi:hypothetical protein
MREIEIVHKLLEVGKAYKTVEWTRRAGIWPNEKWFTTNIPKYVGKFVKTVTEGGGGDGARVWSIFDDNGKENRVNYKYEGTTSFIEVSDEK